MPYGVEISPAAQRQIRSMPSANRRRLEEAIYALEENPRPRGSMKLRGQDRLWRIRAGRYRAIYEVYDDARLVVILGVAIRGEATYRRLS